MQMYHNCISLFPVSVEPTPQTLSPTTSSKLLLPRAPVSFMLLTNDLSQLLAKLVTPFSLSFASRALYSPISLVPPFHLLMQSPTCSVCGVVAEMRQIHMDYRVLWRKRDGTATLSRGELADPCLDRLLLLFWAHYIEDGPHLVCTGSL